MYRKTLPRFSAVYAKALSLLVASALPCFGQQGGAKPSGGVDAAAANDPSAPLSQLQVQDWYNPVYDGSAGQGNLFFVRPIISLDGKGAWLPSSIVRFATPVTSLPNGRTGLGDTELLNVYFPGWHPGDKIKIGLGPVIIAPSATNRYAGGGQWQVGPASLVVFTGVKKLVLGGIFDNPVTVTGERSRPGQNALTFEPLIIASLPHEYFIRIDPYFKFDWKDHGSATLPVNFGFGRLLQINKVLYNVYVQPEVLARKSGIAEVGPSPKFTLRLVVTRLFPKQE